MALFEFHKNAFHIGTAGDPEAVTFFAELSAGEEGPCHLTAQGIVGPGARHKIWVSESLKPGDLVEIEIVENIEYDSSRCVDLMALPEERGNSGRVSCFDVEINGNHICRAEMGEASTLCATIFWERGIHYGNISLTSGDSSRGDLKVLMESPLTVGDKIIFAIS